MEQLRTLLLEELRSRLPIEAMAAEIEGVAQEMSRELWGPVLGAEWTARAASVATSGTRCRKCGGRMRLVDRTRKRQLSGLLGESTVQRAYLHCAHCGEGVVPADEVLGFGAGAWSPLLVRAGARLWIEAPFEAAAEALSDALRIPVPAEEVRRVTEGIGAVA